MKLMRLLMLCVLCLLPSELRADCPAPSLEDELRITINQVYEHEKSGRLPETLSTSEEASRQLLCTAAVPSAADLTRLYLSVGTIFVRYGAPTYAAEAFARSLAISPQGPWDPKLGKDAEAVWAALGAARLEVPTIKVRVTFDAPIRVALDLSPLDSGDQRTEPAGPHLISVESEPGSWKNTWLDFPLEGDWVLKVDAEGAVSLELSPPPPVIPTNVVTPPEKTTAEPGPARRVTVGLGAATLVLGGMSAYHWMIIQPLVECYDGLYGCNTYTDQVTDNGRWLIPATGAAAALTAASLGVTWLRGPGREDDTRATTALSFTLAPIKSGFHVGVHAGW